MITRRPLRRPADAGLPLAALIDCVFLLIIYFMLAGTLEQQEADISFALPGTAVVTTQIAMPDVPSIEIDASGRAHVNGQALDDPQEAVYRRLAALLSRYTQGARAAGVAGRVYIAPSPQTPHWAIVRVMDACSLAGISEMSFASQSELNAF